VHLSAVAVQILQQHDASSVCRSKSGGTNVYSFLLIRQLHGQLGDDFDESQQALSHCNHRPLTWKAIHIWGHLRWTFCPIWNTATTRDIAYGSNSPLCSPVLQHLKSLRNSFSKFEREFDANALLKILHFSICKKSPRVLNIHSFMREYLDD
jgi:hypothetical protein